MTAIRLPADQVLVDGDRIVVVGGGTRIGPMEPGGPDLRTPPAWMTAATEPCRNVIFPDDTWPAKCVKGRLINIIVGYDVPCPDCRDGRPIITIEVECAHCTEGVDHSLYLGPDRACRHCVGGGTDTYRLTASEVLEIFSDESRSGMVGIYLDDDGTGWVSQDYADAVTLDLPPAVVPGMFALLGEVVR